MNIKTLFSAIQLRPGMYVRIVSFDGVVNYIDNFISTKRICGIDEIVDDDFSQNFSHWVCDYFNMNHEFSKHWDKVIYINCSSDEEALEKLFFLAEKFFGRPL
ncbi:hypothetical protein QCE62_24440 [Caballeronia sp. LZ033]|uniref:hypothetical protein n=1 Tax=Caballeronia sp. LZ033 TaxID=3038566 RepID=UPI00285A841E|nr:hypothetical protein [Caballeronia sp. LZ033]MDR5816749.1 hypothetical protein [Caballeronia sp. LZ033]